VNLREDAIIARVDTWLAREFAPHRMSDTLHALAEARQPGTRSASAEEAIAGKIAECDRKLAQYRAALDAGANPATVAGWIAETEAEKAACALVMREPEPRPRLTEQEIRFVVDKFADIARVLSDANPDDKAEILRRLGLRLTYHPGRQLVKAQIEAPQGWYFDGVRGATAPINLSGTPFLTGEFSIATRVSRGDVVHDGDVSRVRAGVAVAIHQPCHQ
jgi:site-specific DNA recombinase